MPYKVLLETESHGKQTERVMESHRYPPEMFCTNRVHYVFVRLFTAAEDKRSGWWSRWHYTADRSNQRAAGHHQGTDKNVSWCGLLPCSTLWVTEHSIFTDIYDMKNAKY